MENNNGDIIKMTNNKTLKKDLISVVMSNYNTPINYLKEAIDSVLNQTYSNFEFIIIDDGSTDDSLEFIKSYDDPRIKLFINEENIGLTKTLNKGLQLAQGEFIARMDTDDVCYPERFEKQIAYMKNHPNTIVCGAWAMVIDENNNERTEEWAQGVINDNEVYRIHLLFCNYPNVWHPSVLMRHQLLLDNHIEYNTEFKYAQDYELWTRCSKIANFHIVPKYLFKYRLHSASISRSHEKRQREYDYEIIQNQLAPLHLSLKENVRELHIIFPSVWISWHKGKLFDNTFKKWLKEIIKANKKYKQYDQKKLKKTLWFHWSRMCYVEMSDASLAKRIRILLSLSVRCKLNIIKIKRDYIKQRKKSTIKSTTP